MLDAARHADDGEPLFPIEERAVPASDIPGEKASPTQPYPIKPAPFARQKITEDDVWGLTPWDRGKCKDSFHSLRYEGPFTPPSSPAITRTEPPPLGRVSS